MLRLRIENFDKLPDGGPLEYTVERRGFDFGRDTHLDWALPDANRVVSGKHCEVRFYDDAYWLVDVSTNGTYLNNSDKRVQSPYQLNEGDRLRIGEYIISVSMKLPPMRQASSSYQAPAASAPSPAASSSQGIWETSSVAPPPIDARELMPKPPPGAQTADFLNQAMFVPNVERDNPMVLPKPKISSAWSVDPEPGIPSQPEVADFKSEPAPQVAAPNPVAQPLTTSSRSSSSPDWMQSFAIGAGLPEDSFSKLDSGAFAELVGQLFRITSSELMAMLHARAEAKALSRGGRTMVRASENNPLKFMPTPEEAMLAMLTPRGKGYLGAREAIEASFADLKQHHIALLAAMQTTANDLLNELSPQAFAKSAPKKKSLLGNAKAEHWDDLGKLWARKMGKHDNGMLDVFLEEFAAQYEKFSRRKP